MTERRALTEKTNRKERKERKERTEKRWTKKDRTDRVEGVQQDSILSMPAVSAVSVSSAQFIKEGGEMGSRQSSSIEETESVYPYEEYLSMNIVDIHRENDLILSELLDTHFTL